MPTSCSAPGCKGNYKHEDRVTLFKMPQKPDQLRYAWVRALRRDDIDELKAVYVSVKHFREEDIEYTHRVPNGDGTFREVPRVSPKLKDGAVPVFLPGCPPTILNVLQSEVVCLSTLKKMNSSIKPCHLV